MQLTMDRQAVRLEAEQQFDFMFTGYRDEAGEYKQDRCLHWALATCLAIRKLYKRPDMLICGGSANFWANDDPNPRKATHIGYFWQDDTDPDIDKWLDADQLPEIHCWVFMRATHEIIDPSVLWIPTVARRKGIEWTRPEPTDWLWVTPEQMPENWFYIPSVPATELVNRLAENVLKTMLGNLRTV